MLARDDVRNRSAGVMQKRYLFTLVLHFSSAIQSNVGAVCSRMHGYCRVLDPRRRLSVIEWASWVQRMCCHQNVISVSISADGDVQVTSRSE